MKRAGRSHPGARRPLRCAVAMPEKPVKPPPEFEREDLKEHTVVKKWKDKGFADMDLLKLSENFLKAYRKDKVKKDKAAVKAAKKAKLPPPEPEPEMANPGIDEPCFTALLTKQMKIAVPDTAALFKAANTSRSGLVNFSEFVAVIATLTKSPPAGEKLSLVFSMYDRDKDGALESNEVKLLLDAGLQQMNTTEESGSRETQIQQIMEQMGSASDERPKWARRGYSKPMVKAALEDPKVYGSLNPADSIGESGITEDQLFESTVVKSSRLCAIL